ncbi:MAG TPA: ABC transporter permease [Vicinamibacteria bacterium]|jgi:ABC-2 type transport system permease protein
MALQAWRAIVRKDLLLFFTDRRAMIMSFAAPIAIASFFGFIFSGNQGSKTARVPVRVVDLDGSVIAKAIVQGLTADKTFEVTGGTATESREAVRRGKTTVAVVIPAGFGEAAGQAFFGGGGKPQLELLYDPSHGAELAMVRGILTQHVMQAVSAEMFGGDQGRRLTRQALERPTTSGGMAEGDRRALDDMLGAVNRWYERGAASPAPGASPVATRGLAMPYATHEEAVTVRTGVAYNGFAHSFAGMGVQFLLFACIDLAVGMLLERQLGLWKRLRAAPLSRGVLLAGKGTSGALIALMVLATTFAFGMIVFRIRVEGSWLAFLAVCVGTALMASTFGLLIAALGKTPPATRGVATLAVLLMVMLGGAWVPSFLFPAWLQKVTLAVPARWAVDGLDATTWRGASLVTTLPTIGALLAFAGLFGALAVARFRWEE